MANLDGEEVDRRRPRRQHATSPPPVSRHDWRAPEESHHDSLPYRSRRGEVQRSDTSTSTPELRRSRTSSRSRRHSTMPLLNRTQTVPYRRGKFPDIVYDGESRSDSQRSSRRGLSPRSAHHSRTTPESKRSSITSLTEASDCESDATAATREDHRRRVVEEEEGRSKSPEKRRHRRRRRASPRRYKIYEEDAEPEPEPERRRTREETKSPSRHSPDRHDSGSSVRKERRHRRVASMVEESRPPSSYKRYGQAFGSLNE
jgi:hypothetical protein